MTTHEPSPHLAKKLGVTFNDFAILDRALSHRSWCAENSGEVSNERLEFLGDAVLGIIVTDYLYRSYPEFSEGQLAKVRSAVVSTVSLATIGSKIELGKYLFLGRGEDQSNGRKKRSILADALEAVIGATYLDQGMEKTSEMVLELITDDIEMAAMGPGGHDYKTRLQELAVHMTDAVPQYVVMGNGPEHNKAFEASVTVNGKQLGSGEGRSKKQAEQAAAKAALHILNNEKSAQGNN